jgi:nucleoside-diphosphate-sugar epimerase
VSKVVVTGSNGFVGAKLCQLLANNGHEVIGIDLTIGQKSTIYQQVALDFADPEIAHLLDSETSVIHLASISTDGDCRNNPELAIEVNLLKLQKLKKLLEICRVKQLIFASSEWVYPEKEEAEIQDEAVEISSNRLNSLYAISKLLGEDILRLQNEIPTTILRFGIVYGPRANPGSAPESLLYSVSLSKDIEVGNLDTSRRFIFVDDLVSGILKIIESNIQPGFNIYNLAGNRLVSLKDIILSAQEITSNTITFSQTLKPASIRNPVSDKFEGQFSWAQKTSLDSGLRECLLAMNGSEK